jgi:hypothetical protein
MNGLPLERISTSWSKDKMGMKKEDRRAYWRELQERAEAEFRDGYRSHLNGEPLSPNARPSVAFMEGWRQARMELAKKPAS